MRKRHKLDVEPIPQKVLYINEPQLADPTILEFEKPLHEELQEDNVRIYVPLDLSKKSILRRLRWVISRYGIAMERNESEYRSEVYHLLEQAEIYDQVHYARKPDLKSAHSAQGMELMRSFIAELEAIPEGDSEVFPYELIDELKAEYLVEDVPAQTVHLRLEIPLDDLDRNEISILKRYGKMENTLSRDVLVPSTMTLHALHYVIQKLFGWQNSHLHHFALPEEVFLKHTDGMFRHWAELCGVYFRMPSEDYEDLYWDDNYQEDQNFDTWLRKKYRGPYRYGGERELFESCREDIREFRSRHSKLDCHPFNGPSKTARLEKATLRDVDDAIYMGADWRELLERLTLEDILILDDSPEPQRVAPTIREAIPLTKELIYRYDYGDNWHVRIQVLPHSIEAREHPEVAYKEMPLCLSRDGLSLMDDVGGIHSYCTFLEDIHSGDPERQEELREWAKWMGWTGRLKDPKRML